MLGRSVVSNPLKPQGLLCPWDSPGKNTGVGSHFFPQRIFLTQESNPSPLHWQADSLPLSHLESPRLSGLLVTFWKSEAHQWSSESPGKFRKTRVAWISLRLSYWGCCYIWGHLLTCNVDGESLLQGAVLRFKYMQLILGILSHWSGWLWFSR